MPEQVPKNKVEEPATESEKRYTDGSGVVYSPEEWQQMKDNRDPHNQ